MAIIDTENMTITARNCFSACYYQAKQISTLSEKEKDQQTYYSESNNLSIVKINSKNNELKMFLTYKPKMNLTKTETNILMNQIRAEKNIIRNANPPNFKSLHDEEKKGKKIFKEHLFNTTLVEREFSSHRNKNHSSTPSPSPSPKPRLAKSPITPYIPKESPKGKKKVFLNEKYLNQTYCHYNHRNAESSEWNFISFNSKEKISNKNEYKFSKKRNDMSPSNQSRLSPAMTLFRSTK